MSCEGLSWKGANRTSTTAHLFDIPNDIMVWLLTGQYFLVVVVVFFSQFVSFEHKFIWRTRNRAEEIHGQATCEGNCVQW